MADIAHGMLRDALDSFVRRDTLLALVVVVLFRKIVLASES